MRRKTINFISLMACLLAIGASAASAQAAVTVDEFETTSSTSQAGGHPDLFTHFKLGGVGPEVPKDVTFNAPKGLFGNPKVLTTCDPIDFAFLRCSSNTQAGLITVHANYKGNPNFLLGTAPVYNIEAGDDEAAWRIAKSIVPKLFAELRPLVADDPEAAFLPEPPVAKARKVRR